MKSIPTSCIKYTSTEQQLKPIYLYKTLYNGNSINFDLTEGGTNCTFKYETDLSVRSYKPVVTKKKRIEGKTIEYEESEFCRCIGFSNEVERIEVL